MFIFFNHDNIIMVYFDLDTLNKEEIFLKDNVHKFAKEVIRPASIKLDKMKPEDRIAPGSPYFDVIREMKRQGYHRIHLPENLGGLGLTNIGRYIVMEELGWASLGLATAIGVDAIPFTLAAIFGSKELYEELVIPWINDNEGKYHGCWGVTEPEHGSDYLLFIRDGEAGIGRGNVIARKEGNEWVINGQKSAWVSAAPVATHMGLHAQIEGGKSLSDGIFAIVPLNIKGVRKGMPSDMLGVRDCPQGEVFFDDVRIPDHYVIAGPSPFYSVFFDQLLCLTSVGVGAYSVGLARAAFEEALKYAKTRIQGGKLLVQHKNIKLKLYEMFEKIETARYYVRKVMNHVYERILTERAYDASPRHARAAQIYAKKIAFEVVNDALQIFGAYGLSSDFIIEKLFRDSRALLIEDGTVEVLSLDAAEDVISSYSE